jgi:hypothetical protein
LLQPFGVLARAQQIQIVHRHRRPGQTSRSAADQIDRFTSMLIQIKLDLAKYGMYPRNLVSV